VASPTSTEKRSGSLLLNFVHFNPGVFEQELHDRMVTKEASPVEGSSVKFWISPDDVDSWIIREEFHKFKVARGAGVPQLLFFRNRH